MSARLDAMVATRRQIVDSAAVRIRESAESLTMLDVAAAAHVSRTMLYRHFSSVTELLDAVAADLLSRAGFERLVAAMQLPDPVAALRQVTVAGTAIWAVDAPLIRNLFFMVPVQPAVVPVIEQLEAGRVDSMQRLIDRLVQADRLRPGLTAVQAVDLLLIVTNFAAWDQLVAVGQHSPDTATSLIVDLAVRAAVRDSPRLCSITRLPTPRPASLRFRSVPWWRSRTHGEAPDTDRTADRTDRTDRTDRRATIGGASAC